MASVIGCLHGSNIIHRDVSIQNLILGEDGYLKMVDFGQTENLKTDRFTNVY